MDDGVVEGRPHDADDGAFDGLERNPRDVNDGTFEGHGR